MKCVALFLTVIFILLALSGCTTNPPYDITATTLPVFEFTQMLCTGTGLNVQRLITENVSCLHDYTLQVDQMRMLEESQIIVISGSGFESFLDDILNESHKVIDSSLGVQTISAHDYHEHQGNHGHDHSHNASDPHIWLSPLNAQIMAKNICEGLIKEFPEYQLEFEKNFRQIAADLDALYAYGNTNLKELSCRQIITFHDGFSYMADAFSIEILHAIEEESGSEAAAAELIELIGIVNKYNLPAVFTERNGSSSAANIIAKETDCTVYALDMAMSGNSYFEAMYYNIDILKEALE